MKGGLGVFCSDRCSRIGRRGRKLSFTKEGKRRALLVKTGSNNYGWKGGISKHSGGYILEQCKNHPRQIKGYVLQHILVVERKMGRYLKKDEEVHHINGIKNDNRIENLLVCNRQDHIRIEKGWKIIGGDWHKPCSGCKRFLKVEGNFYLRSNSCFVSQCKMCIANTTKPPVTTDYLQAQYARQSTPLW